MNGLSFFDLDDCGKEDPKALVFLPSYLALILTDAWTFEQFLLMYRRKRWVKGLFCLLAKKSPNKSTLCHQLTCVSTALDFNVWFSHRLGWRCRIFQRDRCGTSTLQCWWLQVKKLYIFSFWVLFLSYFHLWFINETLLWKRTRTKRKVSAERWWMTTNLHCFLKTAWLFFFCIVCFPPSEFCNESWSSLIIRDLF